jgi:hypothetical protein
VAPGGTAGQVLIKQSSVDYATAWGNVTGGLSYQGSWNALTNTPTLTSSVGTNGSYYIVSVAGTTNLNGITDWQIGDWAIFNGTVWQKIDQTNTVTSVNGQVGAVSIAYADLAGAIPTWNQNTTGTAANVTGVVAVLNGGTGATTAADARTNLSAAYNAITISAGTGLTGGGDLTANRTLSIDSSVVTLTGTQTLTNKTFTSPKINEILDTNGNEILGLSPTASATDFLTVKNGIGVGVPLHIYADGPSASIGLHIQPKGSGLVTISDGTDFNKGIRFRSSGSAASAITLLDAVATAGRVVTLPDATTTLVGRDTTDTLTNKTLTSPVLTTPILGTPQSGNFSTGVFTWPTFNQNTTGTAANVTGTVAVANGGTGLTTAPTDGQIDIGSTGVGFVRTTLTAGTGVSIANAAGSITITATNAGAVTSVTGTSPVVSSGGATPAISLATAYGDTLNPYASKTANYILAAPNGSAGVPVFRAVVAADIPTLNQNTTGTAANVTGVVAIANGGTNATATPTAGGSAYGTGTAYAFTAAGTAGQVLTSAGASAPTWSGISGGTF